MKINKAKMMVSTLAIIAGAATVGSISGTVAWFQYNTRVTAAYVGTTASVSRNLQIRILDTNVEGYKDVAANAYKTNLEAFDIKSYLLAKDALKNNEDPNVKANAKGSGQNVAPVTYGQTTMDAALPADDDFEDGPRSNPMAGQFAYSDWAKASHDNYITIPLQLKLVDGKEQGLKEKKIYLSDLTLQKHGEESADTSTALCVHFANEAEHIYQLWTKTGTDIKTSAKLDLDGDGINDKIRGRYIFNDSSINQATLPDGVYGDATVDPSTSARSVDENAKITSYKTTGANKNTDDRPMVDDEDPALSQHDKAIALGTTDTNGLLTINVTIWFEGWALLNPVGTGDDSAVWNSKYAGKQFDVGMSFATPNVD